MVYSEKINDNYIRISEVLQKETNSDAWTGLLKHETGEQVNHFMSLVYINTQWSEGPLALRCYGGKHSS